MTTGGNPGDPERKPGESRSEAKDRAVRESLEPLRQGERPTVVTVGAILSALLCVSVLVSYVAGLEVSGRRPPLIQALVPAALTGLMAWGMWRARYWAVLGFQTVLVLLMIATALGLLAAQSAVQALGNLVVLAGSGALFWFMVKAMARIQMPERRPPAD